MGRVMLRKRHASRNHYWRASNLLRAAVMPRKRHVSRNIQFPAVCIFDTVMPRKRHVSRNQNTGSKNGRWHTSCLVRGMWVEMPETVIQMRTLLVMPRKRHVSKKKEYKCVRYKKIKIEKGNIFSQKVLTFCQSLCKIPIVVTQRFDLPR